MNFPKPVIIFQEKSIVEETKELANFFGEQPNGASKIIANEFGWNVDEMCKMDKDNKYDYILKSISTLRDSERNEMFESIISFQKKWDNKKDDIVKKLERIFNIKYDGEKLLVANVGDSPILGFSMKNFSFNVCCTKSNEIVVACSIAQIIRMMFEQQFKEMYKEDEYNEKIKTYTREIFVDAVFATNFASFASKKEPPIAMEFYSKSVNGLSLLDYTRSMITKYDIKDYIVGLYNFVLKNMSSIV